MPDCIGSWDVDIIEFSLIGDLEIAFRPRAPAFFILFEHDIKEAGVWRREGIWG